MFIDKIQNHSHALMYIILKTVMQVGFTSSLIQVAEDSGAFEVCVVVTEPGSSTSLEVFLYLQVEIKPGSAGIYIYC